MMMLTLLAALATQTAPPTSPPPPAPTPPPAAAAPAAEQWEPIGQDAAGRYAIDPASIAREGDKVRFRIRAVAAEAQPDGTSAAVVRYLIDCRARTAAVEGIGFYRADGSLVRTRDVPANEVREDPVGDGATVRAAYRRVCETPPPPAAGAAPL